MGATVDRLVRQYDTAAPRWADKMRALGYYDAYLGFLTAAGDVSLQSPRILDVGSGTASFSEAWVACRGNPAELVLLDPSPDMLERGRCALLRRGVEPRLIEGRVGDVDLGLHDVALAAHVLEHCEDPVEGLRQMRACIRPGGKLYLVVSKPHWCNAIIWLQWRHRTYGPEEIARLVRLAGFAVERTYAFPSGPPSRTSQGLVATRR